MVTAGVKTVFVKNVIRYANRGDIPYLQDFDILVDWEFHLTNKQGGLIVVEQSKPVGVYSFCLNKTTYFVQNLHFANNKAGHRLVDDLKERCYKTNHKMINIAAPTDDLNLQNFLKLSGFTAISIDKTSDMWYYMSYRV